MIKIIIRIIKWLVPVILFTLAINITLILCLQDVKYTFEPALLGKPDDFLLDEVYKIIYLFYWVSNLTFLIIYLCGTFLVCRKNKKLS